MAAVHGLQARRRAGLARTRRRRRHRVGLARSRGSAAGKRRLSRPERADATSGDPPRTRHRAGRADPTGPRSAPRPSLRRRSVRRADVHLPRSLRRGPFRHAPRARPRRSPGWIDRVAQEFHIPQQPMLRAGWYAYTRGVLPVLGSFVSPQWRRTGHFLGPSITGSRSAHPFRTGAVVAGSRDPSRAFAELTLGAAVVIWGVKEGRRGDRTGGSPERPAFYALAPGAGAIAEPAPPAVHGVAPVVRGDRGVARARRRPAVAG